MRVAASPPAGASPRSTTANASASRCSMVVTLVPAVVGKPVPAVARGTWAGATHASPLRWSMNARTSDQQVAGRPMQAIALARIMPFHTGAWHPCRSRRPFRRAGSVSHARAASARVHASRAPRDRQGSRAAADRLRQGPRERPGGAVEGASSSCRGRFPKHSMPSSPTPCSPQRSGRSSAPST